MAPIAYLSGGAMLSSLMLILRRKYPQNIAILMKVIFWIKLHAT
jgi:hypothetical protein